MEVTYEEILKLLQRMRIRIEIRRRIRGKEDRIANDLEMAANLIEELLDGEER